MLLRINISGVSFRVLAKYLNKYPSSLLGTLALLNDPKIAVEEGFCDGFIEETKEYYFQRNPALFQPVVLGFYTSGRVHNTVGCISVIEEEATFWRINIQKNHCETCIQEKYDEANREENEERGLDTEGSAFLEGDDVALDSIVEQGSNGVVHVRKGRTLKQGAKHGYARMKAIVWRTTENPETSKLAAIFMGLSIFFIAVTIISMSMESLPVFQETYCNKYEFENETALQGANQEFMKTEEFMETNMYVPGLGNCIEQTKRPVEGLRIADKIIIGWFTFDFLIRFWACPNRCAFMKDPLTIIDLFAIVPFYIELIVEMTGKGSKSATRLQKSAQAGRVLRLLRVLRALRIVKLARYSADIRLLATALRRSISELVMILTYLIFITIIFSTIMYYMEKDAEDTPYSTIPAAAWWSVATMFMYGDAPPITIPGRIIATVGFIAGIMLIAFPVSVLVDGFQRTYEEHRQKQELKKRQQKARKKTIKRARATATSVNSNSSTDKQTTPQ